MADVFGKEIWAWRRQWVDRLTIRTGSFVEDTNTMLCRLRKEIQDEGPDSLLRHLRFCGAMPEHYRHDSSEEKLYSKYTDAVVSETLSHVGMNSMLITARADAADVQATASEFSLVADAKAFRLSRTAKNQKDFKVQAMDGWRDNADHALIVCPIYQLPGRTSQIYQQAVSRNVCILSYSHLATLAALAVKNRRAAHRILHSLLQSVSLLHPSKSASDYWMGLNRVLISSLGKDGPLWEAEKRLSMDSLTFAKKEALEFLRNQRRKLLSLSHQEAIAELVRLSGVDSRIAQVERISHGDLLGL